MNEERNIQGKQKTLTFDLGEEGDAQISMLINLLDSHMENLEDWFVTEPERAETAEELRHCQILIERLNK